MQHPERDTGGPLWAVTSYFNPAGYRRRRLNYRVFRDNLALPLLAIEWSPTGRFELQPGDAEALLQVGGGDLMWQKERLLNLVIARLPASCRYVAWLDCDIVLERPDWPRHAIRAMGDSPIVQLFDRAVHLRSLPETEMARAGGWRAAPAGLEFVGAVRAHREHRRWWTRGDGPAKFSIGDHGARPAPGFAWAAHRELLTRHPLLDAWVIGGGDAAFAYAALRGADQVVARYPMSAAQRSHYLERATALGDTIGERAGCLDGRIFHLWHGELDDRAYLRRQEILMAHGFDPVRDLEIGSSGAWVWRHAPASLRQTLVDYFRQRREDGEASAMAAA